jgi:hypothetical protein
MVHMEVPMRAVNKALALVLIAFFSVASPALAQQAHVVDRAAMDQAIAEKVNRDAADRDLVLRVLDRSEVRELAARMGVSVERAEAAVATLDGAELRELAAQAGVVESALVGGQNVIVISVTTLLLLLILIVLLVR